MILYTVPPTAAVDVTNLKASWHCVSQARSPALSLYNTPWNFTNNIVWRLYRLYQSILYLIKIYVYNHYAIHANVCNVRKFYMPGKFLLKREKNTMAINNKFSLREIRNFLPKWGALYVCRFSTKPLNKINKSIIVNGYSSMYCKLLNSVWVQL